MLPSTTRPRGVFTLHTDASGTAPPDAFGPSRVLHQIGAGALGPVFRAYQPDPGRLVAVKLFRLDVPPDAVHRFVAALNRLIAADLTHMGIAAPLEAGLSEASAYLAMDFVAAESFDVVTRDYGPAPVAEALRIAAQLGGALDFAAAVNVYHGALHPRDVLVSPDDTRVTGLGIAQALEEINIVPPVRRPYTAPERLAGGTWDRRADVFSLAALMYEMLCGRRIAGIGVEAAAAIPGLPGADTEQLRAVFARGLAEDPGSRFETALNFVEALVGLFTQASSQGPRSTRRKRESTSSKRGRAAAPPPLPIGADNELAPPISARPDADVPLPEIADDEVAPAGEILADEPDALPAAANLDVVADDRDVLPPIAPSRVMEFDPPIGMADVELLEAAEERYELAESAPASVSFDEPPAEPSARSIAPPARTIAPPAEVEDEPEPVPILATLPPEVVSEPPLVPRTVTAPARSAYDEAAAAAPSFATVEQPERRSGIWPIALALVVGLLVGFAFGFGAGSRDRSQEVLSTTADVEPSPVQGVSAPPSNVTPPAQPRADANPPAARSDVPRQAAPAPALSAPPARREPDRPAPTARERESPAPSRAAPALEGRLLVRSSPGGARVSVDGRDAGIAPVTVRDLAAGTHVVRLAQEGYVPVERRVRISADQPAQSIEVVLVATRAGRDAVPATAPDRVTGSLMVDSRPSGARVFVDNRLVGTTPMLIDAVDAGEHAVRLELEGFNPWSTSVRVAGGGRGRVSGSLEQR